MCALMCISNEGLWTLFRKEKRVDHSTWDPGSRMLFPFWPTPLCWQWWKMV